MKTPTDYAKLLVGDIFCFPFTETSHEEVSIVHWFTQAMADARRAALDSVMTEVRAFEQDALVDYGFNCGLDYSEMRNRVDDLVASVRALLDDAPRPPYQCACGKLVAYDGARYCSPACAIHKGQACAQCKGTGWAVLTGGLPGGHGNCAHCDGTGKR